HQVTVVLVFDDSTALDSTAAIPGGPAVILAPDVIVSIITSVSPISLLAQLIRQSVSRSQLNPFDIELPTNENMFFRRARALRRLFDYETLSFSIAGPSKIGKTSLLHQYRRLLGLRRDPRYSSSYFIDFSCCEPSPTGSVRRYFFKHFDPDGDRDD